MGGAPGPEARFRDRPAQRGVLGLKLGDAAGGGGVRPVLPRRAPGAAVHLDGCIRHERIAGASLGVLNLNPISPGAFPAAGAGLPWSRASRSPAATAYRGRRRSAGPPA